MRCLKVYAAATKACLNTSRRLILHKLTQTFFSLQMFSIQDNIYPFQTIKQ